MGFRTAEEVREEKYEGKFVLQNDKDYADVILLYRSTKDVLVADVHYIKSNAYNGYAHCLGAGCPACARGIRTQTKLFIPMYVRNIGGKPVNQLLFWDRTMKFEPQLNAQVFNSIANPSEYVYRITRNGAYHDINTTYNFTLVGSNHMSYDEILASVNTKMPDAYEMICKSADAVVMNSWLNSASAENLSTLPDYTPAPRVSVSATSEPDLNCVDVLVSADDALEEIEEAPDFD